MAISVPPFQATDSAVYEHFMGRWSHRLAGPFLDFAEVRPNQRVLDVGCGTGVITIALDLRVQRPHGVEFLHNLVGPQFLRPSTK